MYIIKTRKKFVENEIIFKTRKVAIKRLKIALKWVPTKGNLGSHWAKE